jgi:hypothetical protein
MSDFADRGVTSFLVAAIKKPRRELEAVAGDPAKLCAAAKHHRIKPEWAGFYIREELNRTDRRN